MGFLAMSEFAADKLAEAAALQTLARERTPKSRSALARRAVGMFARPELFLGTGERALIYDILHKLILDIEISVRRDVSAILAAQRDVPRELILTLANDDIDVAFPVLAKSGVLDDADLIQIVRERTVDHRLAIVGRPSLSGQVSAALVKTGDEVVIVTLLRNKSADIFPDTMKDLVERSRMIASYREPILDRDDLGPALAVRMFLWVSTVLRDRIVEKFGLDRGVTDDLIGQVVMSEIKKVAEEKHSHREVSAELKKLMKHEGRLNADMLILALREGEVPLFVAMFGRMVTLGPHLIGRILFEQDGKGLAIACRSARIGRVAFTSIFALAQKMRAANTSAICQRLSSILDYFDSFTTAAADEVLDHWRRGVDYTGAIRAVERKIRLIRG